MSDIQNWAKLMNESIEAEARADEAYESAQLKAAEAEKQEIEALETEEIDPASLGMTSTEEAEAEAAFEAEENDEIDFSAYGIEEPKQVNEADDREPVSHTLDSVGVKASTASLKAQDKTQIGVDGGNTVQGEVVKLAEAVAKLAEALSKKEDKKVNESVEEITEADDTEADVAAEVAGDVNAEQNPEITKDLPDTTDDYEEFAKKDLKGMILRGRALANKAARYLSRGDKKPLPPKEQKELDDIIAQTGMTLDDLTSISKTGFAPGSFPYLKFPKKAGKEGPDDEWQDYYDTHDTVVPGTGDKGERYVGPVPGFNADVDPHDHSNRQQNKIKARKAAEKADRIRKVLHPDVPKRGQDSWSKADWNKLISNFDAKERNELEADLFGDEKSSEGQAFVKAIFGHDMKDNDWAKAWGVTNSTITYMKWKIFGRLATALEKVHYIKPDTVEKTIEFTKKNIERQNQLADMYNKAVEKAGKEKNKPGAVGFEIEKMDIPEKGVKETMLAMADSGIKKINPVKVPAPTVLRNKIIEKLVKKFVSDPKVSQIEIDKVARWMKALAYNDVHAKTNSGLSKEERAEYDQVRMAVVKKTATPEQKARFKELIAKKNGIGVAKNEAEEDLIPEAEFFAKEAEEDMIPEAEFFEACKEDKETK